MADLDALRTFIAAIRTGSFAGAARRLNLSPAMVGRRIQALEARYQLKLIERTTRTQRLTEAGQRFLTRAEAVSVELMCLDVGEHPRDLATKGAMRVAPVVMEALAVDVGAAGNEGEEADQRKLLVGCVD